MMRAEGGPVEPVPYILGNGDREVMLQSAEWRDLLDDSLARRGVQLRPAWIGETENWRELKAALKPDTAWIEKHWRLAGGRSPVIDTSWLTTAYVR